MFVIVVVAAAAACFTQQQQQQQQNAESHTHDVCEENSKKKFPRIMSDYPLHDAARRGDCVNIRKLVELMGYNVNQPKSKDLRTPLHLAAHRGHVKACALLIELGGNVNARNYFGARPLHAAAIGRSLETCEFLIRCGAKASATTSTRDAETALRIVSNARQVIHVRSNEYRRLTEIIRFLRPVPYIQRIQFRLLCSLVAFHRGFPVVVWSTIKEFLGGYYLSPNLIQIERERSSSLSGHRSFSEDEFDTDENEDVLEANTTIDDFDEDVLIDFNSSGGEEEDEEDDPVPRYQRYRVE